MSTRRYDKEEQAILDAYEKGKIKARSPSKKEMNDVKTIAETTFRKNRRITMEKGVPYQTLISGMIHQYIEGELVEKKTG